MTCTLGTDKDGNRFIACRRGERRQFSDRTEVKESAALIGPWLVGAGVEHDTYGAGVIIERTVTTIVVQFHAAEHRAPKFFLLALVGKRMRVIP